MRRQGFARVPNHITDAIARADLTARELRVWLALVQRRILGWRDRRKSCRVSVGLAELAEATGLAKTHVSLAIRGLEERGIISRVTPPNAQKCTATEYFFEPRPERWNGDPKPEPTGDPVTESVTPPRYRIGTRYQIGNPPVTESVTPTALGASNHAASSAPKERLKKGTSLTIRSGAGSPPVGGYQTEEEFEAELADLAAQNPGLFTPAYLEAEREKRRAALNGRPARG
ncbi:MAG: hypothetical protein AMXMBFR33_02020 [Candidatus Xenobia bacterium]